MDGITVVGINEIVRKVPGGFRLFSKSKNKPLGPVRKSKADVIKKDEKRVQMFKSMKGAKHYSRRQGTKISAGIRVNLVKSGEDTLIKSITFDRDRFNTEEAQEYLKQHGFPVKEGDQTESEITFDVAEDIKIEEVTSVSDYTFEEIHDTVWAAVKEAFPSDDPNDDFPRYVIHKLWLDRAILRRSFNHNENDPMYLFVPFMLEVSDNVFKATLGTPVTVRPVFVPVGEDPSNDNIISAEGTILDQDTFEAADEDQDNLDDDDMVTEGNNNSLKGIKPAIPIKPLYEGFDSAMKEAVINEQPTEYIVENVAVLGPVSLNGRQYPVQVQEAAVTKIEGVRAYANHAKEAESGDPRTVQELIGYHSDVYVKENMTYSNLHLIKGKSIVEEHILPTIRSNPSIIGNSIVASGRIKKEGGIDVVEEIVAVRSVDIVSEPATTHGLFEHKIWDNEHKTIDDNNKNDKKDNNKGGNKVMDRIQLSEVKKDSELMKSLRDEFTEEFKKNQEWADMQNQVKTLKEENETLKQTVKERDIAEQARKEEGEIATLLNESKLPDSFKNDEDIKSMLKGKTTEEKKAVIKKFEEAAQASADAAKSDGDKPASTLRGDLSEGQRDGNGHKEMTAEAKANAIRSLRS